MSARIDLRSDTVSKPSQRMRQAMATAEVGDDWYGDDPTVNLLQDRAAELTGKEAAIYLPTGTLCNQVAVHAYVTSGHLVVCEAGAHIGGTEASSSAALSGVAFRHIAAQSRGLLTADQVAAALVPDPYDVSVVDLVAIENTHQVGGGSVLAVRELAAIAAAATAAGVPLYLDGARIFNACTVAGVPVADYARHANALMFCLSKGLGAPIGSILAGDAEFIREARRLKILFGAAWRQAGIMAAAGLIALADGPSRLHEDHENARALAAGLAELLPGSVDPAAIETNIVFADVAGTGRDSLQWRDMLAAEGVLVTIIGERVRMLTHVGISPADVVAALDAWRRAAKSA
ncbi:MAG TPA: GntG family PLP-dependent aldolase [Streptosporangiaceae bacterium]|nr:GntG family PLP-dependent aldolase [Streptosporangiaceae bacterium]